MLDAGASEEVEFKLICPFNTGNYDVVVDDLSTELEVLSTD